MGKTGKWFRSLLSSKRSPPGPDEAATSKESKKKKNKWAISKSAESSVKFKNFCEDSLASPYTEGLDASKHAIAVAAATAAVAEAALAAAHAAAEVVKLTSSGGSLRSAAAHVSSERRRVAGAVKIQSAFRAYLARRALRALKGLVKLQAHVRGHIVRRQSADMLRRMQAMARIQARASAHRSYTSDFSNIKIKFPNPHHTQQGFAERRKYEQRSDIPKQGGSSIKQMQQNNSRSYGSNINKESSHIYSNWLNHWMEQWKLNNREMDHSHGHDSRSDKILEVDTWKPHQNTRPHVPSWNENSSPGYSTNISSSRLSEKHQKPNPSTSSEEIEAWTPENSLRVHSVVSRPSRGLFTPPSSECSRSLFGEYPGNHPSYMANTESSRAKFRSQSAPKQRMQLEELEASLKYARGLWDSDAISEKGSVGPPVSYKSGNYWKSGGNVRRQGHANFSSMYGHGRQ